MNFTKNVALLFGMVAVLGLSSCGAKKDKKGACCEDHKTEAVETKGGCCGDKAEAKGGCCADKAEAKSCCSEKAEILEGVMTLDAFAKQADSLVGKQVTVSGVVDHVCSHSGKKCFLSSKETEGLSLQVLVGGEIKAFDKALMGAEIAATGVVRENRIPAAKVAAQKAALSEKLEEEHSEEEGHHCSRGLVSVDKMEKWMKENNKDYYAIYYMEGLKYVEVQ